jgi:hypothetical protein
MEEIAYIDTVLSAYMQKQLIYVYICVYIYVYTYIYVIFEVKTWKFIEDIIRTSGNGVSILIQP